MPRIELLMQLIDGLADSKQKQVIGHLSAQSLLESQSVSASFSGQYKDKQTVKTAVFPLTHLHGL